MDSWTLSFALRLRISLVKWWYWRSMTWNCTQWCMGLPKRGYLRPPYRKLRWLKPTYALGKAFYKVEHIPYISTCNSGQATWLSGSQNRSQECECVDMSKQRTIRRRFSAVQYIQQERIDCPSDYPYMFQRLNRFKCILRKLQNVLYRRQARQHRRCASWRVLVCKHMNN